MESFQKACDILFLNLNNENEIKDFLAQKFIIFHVAQPDIL